MRDRLVALGLKLCDVGPGFGSQGLQKDRAENFPLCPPLEGLALKTPGEGVERCWNDVPEIQRAFANAPCAALGFVPAAGKIIASRILHFS